MGKLKKSKLFQKSNNTAIKKINFKKYRVTTNKENFLNKEIKPTETITVNNDKITFYTNDVSDIDSQENTKITNRYQRFYKTIIKKHFISLLAILIIVVTFVTSSFFIRDIRFEDEATYNYDVYLYIKSQVKKVGPFYILNGKVSEISTDLREKFPYYAFIGLSKKGANLQISIIKEKIPGQPEPGKIKHSNLIASDDGLIVGIMTERGVPIVLINQVVKKGDLLISGNLNYHVNPSDISKVIDSKGIVLADVARYEKIVVPKVIEQTGYSGRMLSKLQIEGFGKGLFANKSPFENYYLTYDTIFTLGKNFRIYRRNYYEIIDYTIEFDQESAYLYAFTKIKANFELKKINSSERIHYIRDIDVQETEDEYIFTFLVKYTINIATKQIVS